MITLRLRRVMLLAQVQSKSVEKPGNRARQIETIGTTLLSKDNSYLQDFCDNSRGPGTY